MISAIPNHRDQDPSLDVFQILWRHKGKVLLVFALVFAGAVAYLSLAPRSFESEAKLFVRLGRETVSVDPTAAIGQTLSIGEARENEINSILELIGSRMLVEQVVDALGPDAVLEKDSTGKSKSPIKQEIKKALARLEPYNLNPLRVYSIRDKAIAHLQENLGIRAPKKTSVIDISYESEDPRLAQQILQKLIEGAKDEHLRINRTKGSQEFFDEQASLLSANLARRENELRELKNSTGLASFEQQRQIQLARIGLLEDDLVRAQSDLRSAEAEVEARTKLLATLPELIVAQQVTGQPQTPEFIMRQRLFDLEIQEEELVSKFTAESPRVKAVRKQMEEARRIVNDETLKTQVTKATNKTREASDLALHERGAQIAALKARTETLVGQIAAAESEVKSLNDNEIKLAKLQREIDLADVNYRRYAENLEQARIDHELQAAKISSINVLQPPSYSETPASPNPQVVLGLGMVLALCSGAAVAMLAERMRRRQPAALVLPSLPRAGAARPVTRVAEPPESETDMESDLELEPVGANGHSAERPIRSVRADHPPANPR